MGGEMVKWGKIMNNVWKNVCNVGEREKEKKKTKGKKKNENESQNPNPNPNQNEWMRASVYSVLAHCLL